MRILNAGIQAVEPGSAVRRFLQRRDDKLVIEGKEYQLFKDGRIRILGLGKAAYAMSLPLAEMLSDLSPRGLLISKHPPVRNLDGFEISTGGHPIPNEASLQAGQKAIEFIQHGGRNDLLICLVSGGGSALMSAPFPGISIADLDELTSALLACGARVDEINTLRRHLDSLKGGGVARLAYPARVISLILSDVVNNPLEGIASGPTAPDPSTREDTLAILEKYHLVEKTARSILDVLKFAPETAKPGDGIFEHVQNVIVGSNRQAAEAALEQAQAEGFAGTSLGNDWQGEARLLAEPLCRHLVDPGRQRPFCLVAGGETTVTLHGNGTGGRNQELALAAVELLAGQPDVLFVTLATDGEDGPTDAAGAVVSGDTLNRGRALGPTPQAYLENNDSHEYFRQLGDLLKPGPTGTNVNDLMLGFGFQ
jgi:hydroxypyruvate reductase